MFLDAKDMILDGHHILKDEKIIFPEMITLANYLDQEKRDILKKEFSFIDDNRVYDIMSKPISCLPAYSLIADYVCYFSNEAIDYPEVQGKIAMFTDIFFPIVLETIENIMHSVNRAYFFKEKNLSTQVKMEYTILARRTYVLLGIIISTLPLFDYNFIFNEVILCDD